MTLEEEIAIISDEIYTFIKASSTVLQTDTDKAIKTYAYNFAVVIAKSIAEYSVSSIQFRIQNNIFQYSIDGGETWINIFDFSTTGAVTSVNSKTGVVNLNANDVGAVPYIGATDDVNLDSKKITANEFVKKDGTSAQFLKADGSVDSTIIPTKTSDLINDGDNGVSHFISLEDLPSNLVLYATNVASGISTYVKLVTSITDVDYNTTAVNISTGTITGTSQYLSGLITSENIIVGNPGIFTITTIGNIRHIAGSGSADFYFEVWKRDVAATETLITTSNTTLPVTNGGYSEFSASALWNDGTFLSTDRILLKFYANRISGGSNPTYEFQFGGLSPVRTLVPIPLNVVPVIKLDEIQDVTISGSADKDLLSYESSTSLWKNKTISNLGIAKLDSPTFTTSINGSFLTASEILITDASKNIISAPVATYPSLTELSYTKGVTSSLQTQINGKQATLTNPITGTGTNNEIAYFNATGSTIASLTTATYPSLTELSYVKGLGSAVQTQLDSRWKTTGNSGTTAGTNYIGTSDAIDLVLKTSATERLRILSTGEIGIGVSPTNGKLEILTTSTVADFSGLYVAHSGAAAGVGTVNYAARFVKTGASTINYGLRSEATGASANYAIYGLISGSNLGTSLYGDNSATTNGNQFAVYGQKTGNTVTGTGYAVSGSASGTAATNYGGYFTATGATANYGTYTSSADGVGLYALNTGTTSGSVQYVGRFAKTGAIGGTGVAIGVDINVGGASTTNYGMVITIASATTNYGIYLSSANYGIVSGNTGWSGFGTYSPSALVEVQQATLGNEVMRISSIATNDDPMEQTYQGRVATTNATPATLLTISPTASYTTMIEARVVARRTGGTAGTAEDAAGYIFQGTYKNTAGTVALIGTVNAAYTAESVGTYNATLVISGSTVLVQVTGVASTNITWHCTVRVYRVGS